MNLSVELLHNRCPFKRMPIEMYVFCIAWSNKRRLDDDIVVAAAVFDDNDDKNKNYKN